jgi:hypothetical protein
MQQRNERMTICVAQKEIMVVAVAMTKKRRVGGAQHRLRSAVMLSIYLTKIEKWRTKVQTKTGDLGATLEGERC